MADLSEIDPNPQGDAFNVEVRRPLHSPNPRHRLRKRWRARNDRRRGARAARRQRDEKIRWWEAFDLPVGEMDGFTVVVLAIAAAILLVLFLIFAGPFLWILVLFVAELLIWFVVAIAGVAAWLVLGRPWQVVVTDSNDSVVASVPVHGRRRAREHAARVEQRLSSGANPTAAVTTF